VRQNRRKLKGVKEDFDAGYAAHQPRTERVRMWLAKARMEAAATQRDEKPKPCKGRLPRRLVREQEVGGSNPLPPTIHSKT
jgi:hypothetical protein